MTTDHVSEGLSIAADGAIEVGVRDGSGLVTVRYMLSSDEMRQFAARLFMVADLIQAAEQNVAAQDDLNRGREPGRA